MKKLLIFLFAFVAFTASAQDPQSLETVQQESWYESASSYFYYHGSAAAGDTIGVTDSTWTYTVRIRSKFALKPHVYFSIDSTGGTFDTTNINLYSKVAYYEPWVLRETAAWNLGSDTTGILESDSSHISEFWKFEVKSTNNTLEATIDEYFLKWTEDR